MRFTFSTEPIYTKRQVEEILRICASISISLEDMCNMEKDRNEKNTICLHILYDSLNELKRKFPINKIQVGKCFWYDELEKRINKDYLDFGKNEKEAQK